jgi:enhancer of mRNA-decapping protein 4
MITGADDCRELRLWTCKTWACLQTLRILPPPPATTKTVVAASGGGRSPQWRFEMDLSGHYLLATDIHSKV